MDNGIGFDIQEVKTNPSKGIGIRNIESRLSVVNGRVVFDVAKGKGSSILIDVNLSNASQSLNKSEIVKQNI